MDDDILERPRQQPHTIWLVMRWQRYAERGKNRLIARHCPVKALLLILEFPQP
jgi:hypothetical protein